MELGELIAAGPPQALPDPTDLAIADISLFLEFERELFLLQIKEARDAVPDDDAIAAREAKLEASLVAMATTGLEAGISMAEFALLRVPAAQLAQAAVNTLGSVDALPFSLSEYEALLEREPAQELELA